MLYDIPLIRASTASLPVEADSEEQAMEKVIAMINDGELPEGIEWSDTEDEIDYPAMNGGE